MIRWLKRRHRWYAESPPTPPPERMEEARAAADRASTQLENVRANDQEIAEQSEHMEAVLARNNLGPMFWAAVAARRQR